MEREDFNICLLIATSYINKTMYLYDKHEILLNLISILVNVNIFMFVTHAMRLFKFITAFIVQY